jgi:hypothetical protein
MDVRELMDGDHATAEELHAQIARRAYEVWQERGGGHGQDLDDWLTAEEEILRLEDARREGRDQT